MLNSGVKQVCLVITRHELIIFYLSYCSVLLSSPNPPPPFHSFSWLHIKIPLWRNIYLMDTIMKVTKFIRLADFFFFAVALQSWMKCKLLYATGTFLLPTEHKISLLWVERQVPRWPDSLYLTEKVNDWHTDNRNIRVITETGDNCYWR